jgi:hypothetical protein
VDTSAFTCDVTPDVELALDFANPAIQAAAAQCEDRRFDGMHFCWEDPDVQQAQQNFGPTCWNGPH